MSEIAVATPTQFIPVGRTSRAPHNGAGGELQVQTEFAPRPTPRVTTCVLVSGRLIHKHDTPLSCAITTAQDAQIVERMIGRQHSAALRIVSASDFRADGADGFALPDFSEDSFLTGSGGVCVTQITEGAALDSSGEGAPALDTTGIPVSDIPEAAPPVNPVSTASPAPPDSPPPISPTLPARRTTLERLSDIINVGRIFTINADGGFLSEKMRDDFKRAHGSVFKGIKDALEIFPVLGNGRGREEGVCELTARRLYLVSHCGFVYFVEFNANPPGRTPEEAIKAALYH